MKTNLYLNSPSQLNANNNKQRNLLIKGTAAIAGGTALGLAINKMQDGENILKKDVLKSLFKVKESKPFISKISLLLAPVLLLKCSAAILDKEKNPEKGKATIKKAVLGLPLVVAGGYSAWAAINPKNFKGFLKGLTLAACAYIPVSILAMRSANKVFSDKKSQNLSEADPNKSLDIKNA